MQWSLVLNVPVSNASNATVIVENFHHCNFSFYNICVNLTTVIKLYCSCLIAASEMQMHYKNLRHKTLH